MKQHVPIGFLFFYSFIFLFFLSISASAQSAEKLYQEGKQLYDAKSYDAAFPKLKAAAEKGHKKAQYRLGRCYDKGHGTAENDEQAVAWYTKAADQGHAKALYELGKCYKNGEGVAKDRKKAVELFAKAAKLENADAELALGKAYLKGKGIAADEKLARKWLSRAISNPKGGADILKDLRQEAAAGDEDATAILKLLKK